MLNKIGEFAARWSSGPLWSQNIGLARTLIAASGLLTMLFTPMSSVIRPAAGIDPPICEGISHISLWCITPRDMDELFRWVAILILAIAASGVAPRLTAVPLWWVLFSNSSSWITVDGGDQMAAVLALILIPYSMTDRRRWHWTTASTDSVDYGRIRPLIARSLIFGVQLQMTWTYLDAVVSKLAVPEWGDGSAMYYWMRDPMFAPSGLVRSLMEAVTVWPVSLAAVTWLPMVLEAALAIAIFLPRRARHVLLPFGLLFHFVIAILMGLWSFGFVMWGGLIIALWWDGSAVDQLRDFRRKRRGISGPIGEEKNTLAVPTA